MKNKDGIGFKAERDSCRVGFKPNDRGEPLNLCEPVYRICCKTVETKFASTTNIHLHNHPKLRKKKIQQITDHNNWGV